MWCILVIPALRSLRQGDHKLEACRSHTARPSVSKSKQVTRRPTVLAVQAVMALLKSLRQENYKSKARATKYVQGWTT